jgi:hypothetical protein
MHRRDLDPTRLAIALIVTADGPHSSETRRAAFSAAQDLCAALEDVDVTEASLAMAMHGAWCSGTRSGSFHPWSRHRADSGKLLEALEDPALDERLSAGAAEPSLPPDPSV